jgi:hypothetical protein
MSRALIVIHSDADRERAAKQCRNAPDYARVEFTEKKRSGDQNDRMWLILDRVSKLNWHGQRYTTDEWKDYFMHAYRGEKWMPFEEGGMIPIGRSSSKLSTAEFSELMTLMEAFCARQNINLPWVEAAE